MHHHTVRFRDTDAAGVVYFANVLAICHEAYEAALASAGLDLAAFFTQPTLALPIVHTRADYWQPLRCGDRLTIHLAASSLDRHSFELHYQVWRDGVTRPACQVVTRHVCIDLQQRQRMPLPSAIMQWLESLPPAPAATQE